MLERLRAILVICLFALAVPLAPGVSAEEGASNLLFDAVVPAPVTHLASNAAASVALVADEDGRFTVFSDVGQTESSWIAPKSGRLANIDAALGEVDPTIVGVTVNAVGDLWAGAVAYQDNFAGAVHGFGRWSDAPIWSFSLPENGVASDADQPIVLTSGGPYHAVGTAQGKLYLLKGIDEGGETKHAHRTYSQDNRGNAFVRVNDVALSSDGTKVLVGTGMNDVPALHLFSDTFFVSSFKRIQEPVQRVAISDDGTRGVAVTGLQTAARAHFLNLETGATIWENTIGATVNALDISPNGETVIIGSQDGTIHMFKDTGDPLAREPFQSPFLGSPVVQARLADNGHAVAAATADGRVHYLSLYRPSALWTDDTGNVPVGLAFGGDERYLIVGANTADEGHVLFTGAERTIEHMAPPNPRLLPGTRNIISVEVGNNGNRMERVTLESGLLPTGWTVEPASVLVAPGEQKTLSIPVTVKKGQEAKTYALPFTLKTATLGFPMHIDGTVPEIALGKTTLKWRWDQAVAAGAPAAYVLVLENLGNVANEMAVGYAQLPPGWSVEFFGSIEARIEPGDSREITMLVSAPRTATIGREAWFDVLVAWQGGEERVPVSILVVDGRSYHDALRQEIGTAPNPAVSPLQDQLIDQAANDLNQTADPFAVTQPSKPKVKESPGGAFAAMVVLGLLGAALAQRHRRA